MQINKKIIICILLILTIFSIVGGVNASDSLNETPTIKDTQNNEISTINSQSQISETNIDPQEDSKIDNDNKKLENTKQNIKTEDSEPQANIYVSVDGLDGNDGKTKENATSLNNAFSIAQNGSTIHITEGTYKPGALGSITEKIINITGEGQVTIDGDTNNRLFFVGDLSKVVIRNINMINGYTSLDDSGALIGNSGNLTIINCTLSDSTSVKNGGAIFNSGNLIIINSTFENNHADKKGGAIYTQGEYDVGSLIIDHCVFRNNIAQGSEEYGGGAINIQTMNSVNIKNTVFDNNKAIDYGGGAIEVLQSENVNIDNCSFINNKANGKIIDKRLSNSGGGAISFRGRSTQRFKNEVISNSLFLNNTLTNSGGGAVYALYTEVTIKNSVIINNTDNENVALYKRYTEPSDFSAKIIADDNWWGSNNKPTTESNGATINRWAILTITNETEIKVGETAHITVNLNKYKTGSSNGTLTNPIIVKRPVTIYTNLENIEGKLVNGEFSIDYPISSNLKIISAKVDSEEQVLFVITTSTNLELTNITGHMGNSVEYSVQVKSGVSKINKGNVEIYFDSDLVATIPVHNNVAKDTIIINKNIGNYTITAKFIDPTKEFEDKEETATLKVTGIDNVVTKETFNNFFDDKNNLISNLPFDEIFFNGDIEDKILNIGKTIILTGNNTLFKNTIINILSSNVKVRNITFIADKNFYDESIIYSEAKNTIIENNTITYNAPNTGNSYVIYLYDSDNSQIIKNNITYIAQLGDEITTIALTATESDNLIIKDNNFNIRIPSVALDYGYGEDDYSTANSAGLVITKSKKPTLDNNIININYNGYDNSNFDTINGVHLQECDNSDIKNNKIELNGHSYSNPLWIDGSKGIIISKNNIIGRADADQTNGISINGKTSATISDNNITAIAEEVVYPIYLDDRINLISTATVKNNNISGKADLVYGIYTEEGSTDILNNNIQINGNYPIGITGYRTNLIIKNNTINSNGTNTGEALKPQSGVTVETTTITVSNCKIEIRDNTLISSGEYTINAKDSNGIIENNLLTNNHTKGDTTIKNDGSNLEIRNEKTKIITPETIGDLFDEEGVLKDTSIIELIFKGTFNNLIFTINKPIDLIGENALFNNSAFNIIANNVKITNIAFTADKIINNINAIIYSEANNTIIENNTITYNAPDTDDSYAIFLEESTNSQIIKNKINYNGKAKDGINTIAIYVSNSPDLTIKNNKLNAIIPSKDMDSPPEDYGWDEEEETYVVYVYFTSHSAGIIIDNSSNSKLEDNNIAIQYDGVIGSHDSIYTIGIHESANSQIIRNNIEINGHMYAYGLAIDGTKNQKTHITDNNITVYSDDYQSNGIEINGIIQATITGNNIKTIAKKVVYPITISDLNHKAESVITKNNIEATANFVYGIYTEEDKTRIENNTVNINGNYTIGIVSHTTNSKIINNIINSIGTNSGTTEGKQNGVPLETSAICASYAVFEIVNNTLKTNGEYCIDAIELKEGTIIKNNNLIANHTKGDASIKNNESIMEIDNDKSSINDVTSATINDFFDENNVLKSDIIFKELIFHGEFKDLTFTINRGITLIGENALFNNTGLKITGDNVKITNITFISDKIINDLNAILYIESKNTVLENNTLKYDAPNTDDSYVIYIQKADGLKIIGNTINYTAKLGEKIKTIAIYANETKNIIFKNNTVTAKIPAVTPENTNLEHNNLLSEIIKSESTPLEYSAGLLLENCDKLRMENNNITVEYNNQYSGDADTINAIQITNTNDSRISKNNIEVTGHKKSYGLSITGEKITITDNNLTSKSETQAYGLKIETNNSTIENNNITATAENYTTGIYSEGTKPNNELTINDNTINVESNKSNGINLNNNNATIINNKITAKGNETTGLNIKDSNATIKDNEIISEGTSINSAGITADNANIEVSNNNIKSSNEKTIDLNNATGTISNNTLTAINGTGDTTISQKNSTVIIDNHNSQTGNKTDNPSNPAETENSNKTKTGNQDTPGTSQASKTKKSRKTRNNTPKQIIVAKNLKVKKSAKVLKIKIKLKKLNKKILKNKKLKLRFRGKPYKAKTNNKGIATFKIPKKVIKKLKKGKTYKYTVKCGKYKITKKITVKK